VSYGLGCAVGQSRHLAAVSLAVEYSREATFIPAAGFAVATLSIENEVARYSSIREQPGSPSLRMPATGCPGPGDGVLAARRPRLQTDSRDLARTRYSRAPVRHRRSREPTPLGSVMPIRPGCPGSEESRTKDLHTKPLRQDPMAWQRESAYRHYSSRTILRGVIGTRCWLGPAEGARYGKESLGSSSYRLSNKANLDVVGDDRWGSQDRPGCCQPSRPHHLALHLPLDPNAHHFIGAMVLASAKMGNSRAWFPAFYRVRCVQAHAPRQEFRGACFYARQVALTTIGEAQNNRGEPITSVFYHRLGVIVSSHFPPHVIERPGRASSRCLDS
jgi:hypothetical protein